MTLSPTRMEYHLASESGYSVTVEATWEPLRGWSAVAKLEARGLVSPEAAVRHLLPAAMELIRQVEASSEPEGCR